MEAAVSLPSDAQTREHLHGVVDEYYHGDWMDAFLTIYPRWVREGDALEHTDEYCAHARSMHAVQTNELRVMIDIMMEKGLVVDDPKYEQITKEYLRANPSDSRKMMRLRYVDVCRLFGDGISEAVDRLLQHATNEIEDELGHRTAEGDDLRWIGQGRDDVEVAALNLLEFACSAESEALLQTKPHLFVDIHREVIK